jgi:hypothetical protein
MLPVYRLFLPLALWATLTGVAAAQPALTHEWDRGTTITGFAGVASDSAASGPVLGGTLGWEVTPRLGIEGSGSWLEFGGASSAFAGDLRVRTRLWGRRHVDPFIEGGIGLYRATYDARHESAIPSFYRRRMPDHLPDALTVRTFTDPTVVVGGGANVFLSRHLALRPDVAATIVLRNGRQHLVTTAGLHAVVHFEEHPVTPLRRK